MLTVLSELVQEQGKEGASAADSGVQPGRCSHEASLLGLGVMRGGGPQQPPALCGVLAPAQRGDGGAHPQGQRALLGAAPSKMSPMLAVYLAVNYKTL